jgi:hypothetical protein
MSFMFYEVWAVDEDGHEELVGSTASKTDAQKMAQAALEENEQYLEVWIGEENEQGDLEEIGRLTITESGSIIKV